jgi:hypothetical protein
VKRLLLVCAMILSLWPVAFIALSLATAEEAPSDTRSAGDSSADEAAVDELEADADAIVDDEPAEDDFGPPEPDCATVRRLKRRSDRLDRRFQKVQLTEGVAIPDIAAGARALVRAQRRWLRANAGTDQQELNLMQRQLAVHQAIATLSEAPDQARLDAFNGAVKRYNRGNRLTLC